MLLRRMVPARSHSSLSTSLTTSLLLVKMRVIWFWRATMSMQKKRPIIVDVATATLVAKFAPWPLPAPSSLATRTLVWFVSHSIQFSLEILLYSIYSIWWKSSVVLEGKFWFKIRVVSDIRGMQLINIWTWDLYWKLFFLLITEQIVSLLTWNRLNI